MEALIELIGAVVTLILEATFHAATFIVLMLLSVFSPQYRSKLRESWNKSKRRRCSIIAGVIFYTCALILSLIFWIPFGLHDDEQVDDGGDGVTITYTSSKVSSDTNSSRTITLEFSTNEVERIKKTVSFDELLDVGGEIIKKKLGEAKNDEPDQ